MIFFSNSSAKLPFRIGCIAAAAYLFVFFYYFPSANDSFLYIFFWIAGFFLLPVIITFIFSAGTILGLIMPLLMNIFGFKKNENSNYYRKEEKDDNSDNYINIDDFNKDRLGN